MKKILRLLFIAGLVFCFSNTFGQMRQVYIDNNEDNAISKLSFFAPSEGYVAFKKWIGYTTDSGRTFTKKYISINNVDYNGYYVNLTFGFAIKGVKAFNKNIVIAYGDYGLVPAILYSGNGGNTFKLVFHSQFSNQFNSSITDVNFPENNSIGYAVDGDRILKTSDMGLTWSPILIEQGSFFTDLQAVDNNNIIAFSTDYPANKLIKSTNGGSNWQTVPLPTLATGEIISVYFLSANIGWLSMYNNGNPYFYKTVNGGDSWNQQNDTEASSFVAGKLKFIDENIGYSLSFDYLIYKTFNSGVTWEPLPRDNNFTYLGYSHHDLQCFSANQLWAGGGYGILELSVNGGGTPLPRALIFHLCASHIFFT